MADVQALVTTRYGLLFLAFKCVLSQCSKAVVLLLLTCCLLLLPLCESVIVLCFVHSSFAIILMGEERAGCLA